MKTLTIKEVAAALNIGQQALRVGIQKGRFPFAKCWQNEGSHRYYYWIPEDAFKKWKEETA